MCLAVPARVIEIDGDKATADAMGNRWEIRITLTPEVEVGDIVLIHAGYAIAKVDEEEAAKTWELFEQIAAMEAERHQDQQEDDHAA
jgi:hydrogenase expression/formation protein HypC